MKRQSNFLSIFIALVVLTFIFYFLSKTPVFNFSSSVLSFVFSPIQSSARNATLGVFGISFDSSKKELKEENAELIKKIVNLEKLKAQNNSLMDQFQTTSSKNEDLIPADVIGAPGFVPGVSSPEFLIIDKGKVDKVTTGDTVIFKNNVIGKVVKVTDRLSKIELISNMDSSFTVKIGDGGVLGVVKGLGEGNVLVDNILLSENLKKGDLVITGANVEEEGSGFPPGFVVGKINSIEKIPSALFQKAEVSPLIDFSRLSTVFIFKTNGL